MARLGEHDEFGVRDQLGHPLGPLPGGEVVTLRADDERRRLDLTELGLDRVRQGSAECLDAAPGPRVDQVVDDRGGETGRGHTPSPAQGDSGRRSRRGMKGGADEDEAVDGGRVTRCQVDGDLTTEGHPDHDRGRQVVLEQPAPQSVSETRYVEWADRLVAQTEARQVRREDRPLAPERLDRGFQGAAGGEAVDQHDRCGFELRPRAVAAPARRPRAVSAPARRRITGATLELGGDPYEDPLGPGVGPAAVYAVPAS